MPGTLATTLLAYYPLTGNNIVLTGCLISSGDLRHHGAWRHGVLMKENNMYSHPFLAGRSMLETTPALLRDWSAARGDFARAQRMQRVLVPVDGTPASISAVEHAIAHADGERTHVHVLNVQPPIMARDVSAISSARIAAESRRRAGEHALREARALLNASAIDHTSNVVFGAPAEAIVRTAAERGCTKIVMGSQRNSLLANVMGRSVSSRVVRLAHIPVTVVKARPPERREPCTG